MTSSSSALVLIGARDMAHLLDHESCRVLVEGLVDGHHRAQVHEGLQNLRGP